MSSGILNLKSVSWGDGLKVTTYVPWKVKSLVQKKDAVEWFCIRCRKGPHSNFAPMTLLHRALSLLRFINKKVKLKSFPYSIPSVVPGADPGVQAVSPQVTVSHPPGGRLPLISARPAVTSPAAEHHRPLAGTKLYCLVTEAHRRVNNLHKVVTQRCLE